MSKYKKNKAVALKYNAAGDASPVVIASGYGTVAEHIIDIAEKKGIPVFKAALSSLNTGIPFFSAS